ncbi:S1/P1 nuclease [Psychroflexus aestuariivivens]|uniref:S1/P1 nuclease n=1 Tax=Psychroflexus aestuariivivens TaxID=1795040 RepID=UPI000FD851BE|nr:S1/P1 nuclease [Psychroflexus aestuariivivens]
MNYCLLILYFLSTSLFASEDWGKNGHRTVGAVAQQYLSKKAKRKIDKILNHKSLALVSTYADEIKSDDKYDQFKPWHYANVPFDKKYSEVEKNLNGDVVQGIQTCIEKLKSETTSAEDQAFYLKMLVHLVGDMHQPLHFGLEEDRGANDFKVSWFGESTNLHRVWDSHMIESYKMSYSELSKNLPVLGQTEIKLITKGDLLDWVADNRELTKKVYDSASQNDYLGYRYMYDWFDVLKLQLHKSGIRLAKILNEIYG